VKLFSRSRKPKPDHSNLTVSVRRQHRSSLMMRTVPGGIEVFIPRWMKEDHPKVRAFIQSGLEKIGDSVPPIPAEQTSRTQIEAMVETWAKQVGVQPRRIQFRTMARKWGSCSSRNNITLNTRLCWLPPHLAEYVVLHELVHLRVFNHGKEFKAMMSAHMPDWKERESELDKMVFR
jgi:predicted metal-dependent hydrolase